MACVNPLSIKYTLPQYIPSRIRRNIHTSGNNWEIYVPCGWCLNCRVDKRNFLEDCCNYYLRKFKTNAFCCFTYDNYRLEPLILRSYDHFNNEYIKTYDSGKPMATLKRKDFSDFIKRLRSYIKYHNIDSDYCSKDFKVVYCSEYGGIYDRPHFHALFFGLDYNRCYELFCKLWKNGIVDTGEIKNGGVRYVLDYLDKQVHGSLARELYDDFGLERPKLKMSKTFSTEFVLSKYDEIIKNRGSYICGAFQKLRPVPSYYARKFNLYIDHFKEQIENVNYIRSQYSLPKVKSLKELNEFKHYLALQREKKLINRCRNKNLPVYDTYMYNQSNPALSTKLADLAFQIDHYGDVVPF